MGCKGRYWGEKKKWKKGVFYFNFKIRKRTQGTLFWAGRGMAHPFTHHRWQTWQMRVVWTAIPLPHSQGQLMPTSDNRASSIVLRRWEIGTYFLSVAAGKSDRQLSNVLGNVKIGSSGDSSPTLTALGLPHPHHCQQGWLHFAAQERYRDCSPCCLADEGQEHLSHSASPRQYSRADLTDRCAPKLPQEHEHRRSGHTPHLPYGEMGERSPPPIPRYLGQVEELALRA